MKKSNQKLRNMVFGVAFVLIGIGFPGGEAVAETVAAIEWVSRYNGPGNAAARPHAMAVDAAGNVYVTGHSSGSAGISQDYATIKYDANGNEVWVPAASRYNRLGNGMDGALAMAVDAAGNVYVTGWSEGSGTGQDYATIKYDANGNEVWVSRYNGLGNSTDNAHALAVDAAGNVYVTGWSEGSGTGYDYATIKYDANGNEVWVSHYNGPGNDWDKALALAVDAAGNVYVTGESRGLSTSYDYATIKYKTIVNEEGAEEVNEEWVARYNGPGNAWDSASALAVDAAGNVYVTGPSGGSGTSSDYATIKYKTIVNEEGAEEVNEEWVARYNGPGNATDSAQALAVDAAGNVYVTGWSDGSDTGYDYATIKYKTIVNEEGAEEVNEEWVARYNGPGNDWDSARALAVDAAGNVYVTGWSDGSDTSQDYATIKYKTIVNEEGSEEVNEEWVARYNGPGNAWDRARALAVDAAGNVYVTGWSDGSGTGVDYATIKYNQLISVPGFQPSGLAYDGKYLYVSELSGFRKIYRLDPVTGRELDSYLAPSPTGQDGRGNPNGLAYGAGRLFVSDIGDFGAGIVYEIDVGRGTIYNSFSLPFRGGGITFDGTNLYIADHDSGTVHVTDRSGTLIRTFNSQLRPAGMTFDPASGHLWVISEFDSKISEITTNGVLIRSCDGSRGPGIQGLGGVTLVGSKLYLAEVSDPDPFNPPAIPGTLYIVELNNLVCTTTP